MGVLEYFVAIGIHQPGQSRLRDGKPRAREDATAGTQRLRRSSSYFRHAERPGRRVFDLSAQLAPQAGGHGEEDLDDARVELALVSHDAGGITARDARMARQLSAEFPA